MKLVHFQRERLADVLSPNGLSPGVRPCTSPLATLSDRRSALDALHVAEGWPGGPWAGDATIFLHADATGLPEATRFQSVVELTREVFPRFDGLVYVAPVGLVVRAVAPCLRHKTTDPGVVVVDVGARWAVSLVGGHEGGANALAFAVANILGAEPVVTTSTEAAKDLIVGVGCRRGARRTRSSPPSRKPSPRPAASWPACACSPRPT